MSSRAKEPLITKSRDKFCSTFSSQMIPLAGCSLPAGYTKVINQIFIHETTYITKDSFILEGATQLPQGCMIYWWCLLKPVKLSCDHHCRYPGAKYL